MIEEIESFNHLMGLDPKRRNLYDGISPERMRRRTPTTGVEEIKRGKRIAKMGFKLLGTEDLPVVRMVAKEPTITIAPNGQGRISTAAAAYLEKAPYVSIHHDVDNNLLGLRAAKSGLKVTWPTKSKSATVGLAGILRRDFPMYDFNAAGVQPFKCSIGKSKAGSMLVIKIPSKTPEYRAPAKRVKKVKLEATASAVEGVGGDDIPLE